MRVARRQRPNPRTTWSSNIRCISRGTPGMKNADAPLTVTPNPGAVPTGLTSMSAPCGKSAWLERLSVSARPAFSTRRRIASSEASSRTVFTPIADATACVVRSSVVGPRPRAHDHANGSAEPLQCRRDARRFVVDDDILDDVEARSVNAEANHVAFVLTSSPRVSSVPMHKTAHVMTLASVTQIARGLRSRRVTARHTRIGRRPVVSRVGVELEPRPHPKLAGQLGAPRAPFAMPTCGAVPVGATHSATLPARSWMPRAPSPSVCAPTVSGRPFERAGTVRQSERRASAHGPVSPHG